VLELLQDRGIRVPVRRIGLPDAFVPHVDAAKQRARFGIAPEGIAEAVRSLLGERKDLRSSVH